MALDEGFGHDIFDGGGSLFGVLRTGRAVVACH